LPNTCKAYGAMLKKRRLQILIIIIALLTPILSHGQEDWMNQGYTALRSRQFSAAVEAFTRAIEMDPDNAEAYNHRGVARAYIGKIDDAISDYTRALEIKPELVGALNNRGSAYYQKKLLNQAIADYSKAIEINPYLAEAYSNRGTAWASKGDYFRAIRDYTQALEANPFFDAPYYNRGRALLAIGDYGQAIADLERVIELNPKFHDAYHLLATIFAECADPKYRNGHKAVVLAKKAVDLNPDPEYLSTLATAYAEADQFDHAILTQQRAVEMLREQGKTVQVATYQKRLEVILAEKRQGEHSVPIKTDVNPLPETAVTQRSVAEKKEEKPALQKKAPAPEKLDRTVLPKKTIESGGRETSKKEAPVKKEILKKQPAQKEADKKDAAKKRYTVQTGAFLSEENAAQRQIYLAKKGYPAAVVMFTDRKGRIWHTVRLGRYENLKDARQAAKKLAAKEKIQTSVRPGGSL
jgi:tetratricopeptide (TPR) repeat protein